MMTEGSEEEKPYLSLSDHIVRLFVGRNSNYYTQKWETTAFPSKSASWNWSAFLFNVLWFGYRRMYLYVPLILGIFGYLFE